MALGRSLYRRLRRCSVAANHVNRQRQEDQGKGKGNPVAPLAPARPTVGAIKALKMRVEAASKQRVADLLPSDAEKSSAQLVMDWPGSLRSAPGGGGGGRGGGGGGGDGGAGSMTANTASLDGHGHPAVSAATAATVVSSHSSALPGPPEHQEYKYHDSRFKRSLLVEEATTKTSTSTSSLGLELGTVTTTSAVATAVSTVSASAAEGREEWVSSGPCMGPRTAQSDSLSPMSQVLAGAASHTEGQKFSTETTTTSTTTATAKRDATSKIGGSGGAGAGAGLSLSAEELEEAVADVTERLLLRAELWFDSKTGQVLSVHQNKREILFTISAMQGEVGSVATVCSLVVFLPAYLPVII